MGINFSAVNIQRIILHLKIQKNRNRHLPRNHTNNESLKYLYLLGAMNIAKENWSYHFPILCVFPLLRETLC